MGFEALEDAPQEEGAVWLSYQLKPWDPQARRPVKPYLVEAADYEGRPGTRGRDGSRGGHRGGGRAKLKVFGQAFYKKLVGVRGQSPCDLKSGAAAREEGRSIVIPARRAVNNAPALFLVASPCAGGSTLGEAHPRLACRLGRFAAERHRRSLTPLPRPYQGGIFILAGAGGGISF